MKLPRSQRIAALLASLDRRILVLDGAMGTAIQSKNLTAKDFGGPELEGCNEYLSITRPDVIREIHDGHLAAGCDIVETNTFGSTPLVLDEFGLGKRAEEITKASCRIAREACDAVSTAERPRFVAGSVGPTTKAITVTGGATFDEMAEHFYQQQKAMFEADVDYLLIETCQDTRNVKAALLATDRIFAEKGEKIPVAVSVTIEPMGTMLAGQSIEALLASLAHRDLLYLGLNCATGPEFMTDHIRSLARLSPFRVACVPNAGLPDEHGCYLESPDMVATVLKRFIDSGWINLVGGCCGTVGGHVAALAKIAAGAVPHEVRPPKRSFVSGIEYLEITDEMRPVIVGERTNVIGSRKFKKLICDEKFDEGSDIARAQVKGGAQILDVCLANPDREEYDDMKRFLEFAIKKVKAPLMIDSTDEKVIELGLKYSQGKSLINSVNLEDGEERFEKVLPLAKSYGAALVVGTIDDDPQQGMGVTRQRKLEIAEREYDLIVNKYKIPPEDIYWDPLVFPCATGDQQYIGSAVETIEGIRLIKQKFPATRTILGISNVSFGLPAEGREILNSVFLYHCVQAGLDLAIVNSEKLVRFASIPEDERKLAEDLLYNRGADPIAAFAAHFRKKKPAEKVVKDSLPLEERLPRYILEGSKDGLIEDLDLALKTMKPMAVINGPLMKGMDEVGRLFNANQLIVAEVLQSAEAMKAAVSHLEKFMEKSESSIRGKVILATVKGDVHDIGKNLVEIILANNGFQVVNLGIKVPPEQLIQAVREHKPDIIGLSGLLVKSAQQMVITADDMTKAGTFPPMLVGGAALSENFVDKQIAVAYGGTVAYARDAMSGLDLAKQIVQKDGLEMLKAKLANRRAALAPSAPKTTVAAPVVETRSKTVPILETVPKPSDFERHVLKNTPIDQIWQLVNPMMLYGRHLGVKGDIVRKMTAAAPGFRKELEQTEPKTAAILQAVDELKEEFRGKPVMQPSAVFRFFKAGSRGNKLIVGTDEGPVEIEFPRQRKTDGLCLADYTLPAVGAELPDSIAMFLVSVGKGVREAAEDLKARGDYLRSHILQALALESAEGYAEWIHAKIRAQWGYPDAMGTTNLDRFQAKYRGKRYSFGYPACPRLDDQAIVFKCLKPEELGVHLTEGFMMDPEATVSALVFHHPNASYFSVGASMEEGQN